MGRVLGCLPPFPKTFTITEQVTREARLESFSRASRANCVVRRVPNPAGKPCGNG